MSSDPGFEFVLELKFPLPGPSACEGPGLAMLIEKSPAPAASQPIPGDLQQEQLPAMRAPQCGPMAV